MPKANGLLTERLPTGQQLLQRLIALIRLKATQNIALRGTPDWLNKPNNGNILKFVVMLGIFDGIMKKHVRRIQSKETHVNYLGKRIQNGIVDMLAQEFQQAVCSELKAAKYVSIILDCTPDKSKTDQMTTVVHFVSTEEDGSVRTREHFLEFSELLDSTGWA
ncbi:unnamed protein product [Oncorhynchus mykiss]|uniref:Uncharacterized protein n=1 Tax=Oncorhynchus mykiss TaxID=8022 RepID=A0A060XG62_ONCMY|nr:unnamed protein product [Oncorhynchus mykiss]